MGVHWQREISYYYVNHRDHFSLCYSKTTKNEIKNITETIGTQKAKFYFLYKGEFSMGAKLWEDG